MGNSIDPMTAQRIGIFRSEPDPHIRCGTCACWNWLTEFPANQMQGRCMHPIRGPMRLLLGPDEGLGCSDWQRCDPI